MRICPHCEERITFLTAVSTLTYSGVYSFDDDAFEWEGRDDNEEVIETFCPECEHALDIEEVHDED